MASNSSSSNDFNKSKQMLTEELWQALHDDDLWDVSLLSSDGIPVQASRFVLAARSPVLKKMLYGSFREAKSTTICMVSYSATILQAVVQYCRTNSIAVMPATESGVRLLVQLSKAADYLQLPGMLELVNAAARSVMTKHVRLACAVLDEADVATELWHGAHQIVEVRPYMALDTTAGCSPMEEQEDGDEPHGGGGIESLRSERLIEVMKNQNIGAGELFLFRMLRRWYEHAAESCPDAALDVAHQCCRYIKFENIEPQALLDEVQNCVFVSPDKIFGAVAKQALRASQSRGWNLGCRGKVSIEKILVEGCGRVDANGLYFRIASLTNGALFSKREVACGQPNVYTLSCSVKDDQYDCRLISSKVLTHQSALYLRSMQQTSTIDPTYQPVLQIYNIEAPSAFVPAPIRNFFRARVSDGAVHMHATLASHLQAMLEDKEIGENSIIKIIEFGLYLIDGLAGVHINKVVIVNSNPGHRFGDPIPLGVGDGLPPQDDQGADDDEVESNSKGVRTLYSCTAPVDLREREAAVPRFGWSVEKSGRAPVPTFTWIPAMLSDSPSSTSRGLSPSRSRKGYDTDKGPITAVIPSSRSLPGF